MRKQAKRILDLLFILLLFGGALFADSIHDEGYSKVFFKVQSIGANATAAIQITEPVARYSLWLEAPASFSFNYTGSGVQSSGVWVDALSTTTLELVPLQLGDNAYINISNGASAQKIRIMTLGK
jgi:hypothetical protein